MVSLKKWSWKIFSIVVLLILFSCAVSTLRIPFEPFANINSSFGDTIGNVADPALIFALNPTGIAFLFVLSLVASLVAILKKKAEIVVMGWGLFYLSMYVANFPNLIHHTVYSHESDTLALVFGNQELINPWPATTLLSSTLLQICDIPVGLFPAVINVAFISIFTFLVPLVLSNLSKAFSPALAVPVVLLFWLFFLKNSIIYEFGYLDQWVAIFLLLVLAVIAMKERSFGGRTVSLILFLGIVVAHPFTSLIAVFFVTIVSVLSFVHNGSLKNQHSDWITAVAYCVIFAIWFLWNHYTKPFLSWGAEWVKALVTGICYEEYFTTVVPISSPSFPLLLVNTMYKLMLYTSNIIMLIYLALFFYARFRKEKLFSSTDIHLTTILVGSWLSPLLSLPLLVSSGLYSFGQRWLWHLIVFLPLTAGVGATLLFRRFLHNQRNATRLVRRCSIPMSAALASTIVFLSGMLLLATPIVSFQYHPVAAYDTSFSRDLGTSPYSIAAGFDYGVLKYFYVISRSHGEAIIDVSQAYGRRTDPLSLLFEANVKTLTFHMRGAFILSGSANATDYTAAIITLNNLEHRIYDSGYMVIHKSS